MPQIVQLHRLASSQAATYIGPPGEIIGDTGANTLRYQDGITPGGWLMMQGGNNLSEISSPSTARNNLGAAPLANPLFTGVAKVNGNIIVDASQLGAGVATLLAGTSSGTGGVAGTVNTTFTGTTTINGQLGVNIAPVGGYDITLLNGLYNSGTYFGGNVTIAPAGTGTLEVRGFGFTGDLTSEGFISTFGSGVEVVCVSNGVILNNGATSWSALSAREYKKNFQPIQNALGIINAHSAELGHYIEDEDDRIKRAFLYYEDAVKFWPHAANYRAAQTLTQEHEVKVDEEHFYDENGQIVVQPVMGKKVFIKEIKEAKTISQTDYIPLLVKAIQELHEIVKNQQAQIVALGNRNGI